MLSTPEDRTVASTLIGTPVANSSAADRADSRDRGRSIKPDLLAAGRGSDNEDYVSSW